MRKLLIVGASILQLPAIKKAKELGFYVGVIDYDPNAIGIPYANEYFNVSTIDIEKIVEVAKQFKPIGIMTLATDMPMRSIAAVCEELGLTGITMDTAIKSTDKGEMIKAFEKNNVNHPWYKIINTEEEFNDLKKQIDFPCITKPTDNSGSRGIALSNNLDELENNYKYSKLQSRSGTVIIEQYMQGQEVSVEAIVINKKINIIAVTDKLTTGAPHFVEMGHSQPSAFVGKDLDEIKELAEKAINAVGINTGPVHIEMMITKEGPKMIELGARLGGDCITTHLVPLSTGIDMIEATIRIACGEEISLNPNINKGSAIRYFNVQNGTIKTINNIEEAFKIDGVKEIIFTKKIGERVNKIENSTDRVGFVIAQKNTAKEAINTCEDALKEIRVVCEKEDIRE